MKKNCCWINYKWVIIQNQIFISKKVKVVLDLSNYATKEWLEHGTGIHASKANDLDVGKLKSVPVDLLCC